jgi:hypothetical protein
MSSLKKILIGAGVFLVLLFSLCGYGAYLFYTKLVKPLNEAEIVPPELQEARILSGGGYLEKKEFYRLPKGKFDLGLSSIVALKVGQLDGQTGTDVGVLTNFGGDIFDNQGQPRQSIHLTIPEGSIKVEPVDLPRQKTNLRNPQFVDVEGDGVTEIFAYSSVDGFALFNFQGQIITTRDDQLMFNRQKTLREIYAGDLDGNGSQEFLSSWYVDQESQLIAFDAQGNTLWEQKPEFFGDDCVILDIEGDGKPEIIDRSGTKIDVFDNRGQYLRQGKMPEYLPDADYIWADKPKRALQVLGFYKGALRLHDLSGSTILKADAPLSEVKLKDPQRIEGPGEFSYLKDSVSVFNNYGAWVRWRSDAPPVLAAVGGFSLLERSVFYIYDEKGKLLYHELLPEEAVGLSALPLDGQGEQNAILIAGENTVWQYRENQVKPVSSPK